MLSFWDSCTSSGLSVQWKPRWFCGEKHPWDSIALGILALTGGAKRRKLHQLILGLGYTALVVLQIPPIILWFAFHGSVPSDWPSPGPFVAHWGYAIPHIVLAIIGILALYVSFRVRAAPP